MSMTTSSRTKVTPILGIGLALLVAGSLVALASVAQQISLTTELGRPVQPVPPPAAAAPPLQLGPNGEDRSIKQNEKPRPIVKGRRIEASAPTGDSTQRERLRDSHEESRTTSGDAEPSYSADKSDGKENPGRALGHEKARGDGHHRHDHRHHH